MTDSEKIIDGLNKFVYDCFINNNVIIILHDGFTKTIKFTLIGMVTLKILLMKLITNVLILKMILIVK